MGTKGFHIRSAPLENESDTARLKRLFPEKKKRTKIKQQINVWQDTEATALDVALQDFVDSVEIQIRALQRLAKLRDITLSRTHASDVLSDALKRKPLLWVSFGTCRPSQLLLEALIANTDARQLIVPEVEDLCEFMPREDAERFVADHQTDHVRRLWAAQKLPRTYKSKTAHPRLNATQGTSPNV